MTSAETPPFSRLLDWLEGRLDETDARELEDRLRSADPAAEADLDWLRAFLDSAEAARATTPPPEVRRDLVQKFTAFARERRAPGLFDRLVAALTFDSALASAPAGIRSVHTEGKQRQLIYETDLAEIALNIFPNSDDENLTLSGQIYPRRSLELVGLSVQIIDPDGPAQKGLTTSDDLGEFMLEGIPPGRYAILISSDGFEIALPEIHLQR
ncbi:MAG TPA: hypothetical protein VMN57_13350 [Anaerolineales bacterium]|nr:hypothetical protein [Anaerolineales bacterium]